MKISGVATHIVAAFCERRLGGRRPPLQLNQHSANGIKDSAASSRRRSVTGMHFQWRGPKEALTRPSDALFNLRVG